VTAVSDKEILYLQEKSCESNDVLMDKEKLIEVETTETGEVKGDVYMHYFRCIGWAYFLGSLSLYIVYQGLKTITISKSKDIAPFMI